VTSLEPLADFYPAEDYHQKFYANNPYQPYCQYSIPPKLNKLHKQFSTLLKSHGKSV
jgi:peptide-methionine (S)-S-oxide reductase